MAAVPLLRATCSFNSISSISSISSTRLFLPSSSLRLASSNQPFLCLKERCRLTPFAASTSEWAQQDEEEKLGWAEGDSDDEQEVVGGESFGSEQSYAEPSEEAKLYVGNLPYEVDSEALAQIFDQAGVVDMAEVIYNRQTDQSRGFGFVTMRTVEEAEKAVQMFNGYEYNGRTLTVNKAAERGSRSERKPREFSSLPKIYVGNLAWQTDDARLMQVFSEYGKVVDARVVADRETGRSRGFGFVTMSEQSELDDAITSLDGQTLDGRTMRVSIAENRPRRTLF